MSKAVESVSRGRLQRDFGSFRDPAGYVFYRGQRVFRAITPEAAPQFRQAMRSEVVKQLMADARLVKTELRAPDEIADIHEDSGLAAAKSEAVAEHARVPFVSYPYEWAFEALRSAALEHLSLHSDLLRDGFTLSDASAFNMQFDGTQPFHIDLLSIVKYEDGERWAGYGQFLRQFLNPLVLEAARGISFAPFYRSTLDGVCADELLRVLPWYYRLRPWALIHLVSPALLDRRAKRVEVMVNPSKLAPLPKAHLLSLLDHLHRIISGLKRPRNRTAHWSDYTTTHGYSPDEREAKLSAVRTFSERVKPDLLVDIGCNTGDYALAALDAGAKRSLGLDTDRAALDAAFGRARDGSRKFLPLSIDIVNPSPSQGWNHEERKSFAERLNADALLALAVLHHMVISNNIPLPDAIRVLTSLAPRGIIEFVPKEDPQVVRLLRFRRDIFPDYTVETARAALRTHARILSETPLTASGRTLFIYERPKDGRGTEL